MTPPADRPERPDRRATTAPIDQGIVSGERRRAHAELLERAARAAGGLRALGVGEDDAVAVLMRNDIAFVEAVLGIAQVGAYSVPINWHFKADEVGYILRDAGAKLLVVHADLLPGVAAALPPGIELRVVPTPAELAQAYRIAPQACAVPAGAIAWDDWLAQQPPDPRAVDSPRSSMLYTSGTTGHPKGVRRAPLSPQQAVAAREVARLGYGLDPAEPIRALMPGPIYHSAPHAYALNTVRSGGLLVLMPRFDPEALLQLIERHRISHLYAVPTMFVRLLQLPESVRAGYDVSTLRHVIHGAAPCPREVKLRMIDWWGPVIHEFYGATESGIVTVADSRMALERPGTVGRALPGATVRILDAQGRELPPNEPGEVFVRQGAFSAFTYHGLPERRAEIDRDGLITCGDVGYLDEDGYLFLCDRVRDMVILGGTNIYPAEIESVLVQMPGVKDCAVFGIPHDVLGEQLCAHVEPQPGVELGADAVRDWLRARVADYKVPNRIVFQSPLPREDSGKIFKRRLREPYWRDAGRNI